MRESDSSEAFEESLFLRRYLHDTVGRSVRNAGLNFRVFKSFSPKIYRIITYGCFHSSGVTFTLRNFYLGGLIGNISYTREEHISYIGT